MSSIWGSSENDIYMCGHASSSPGNLWHYDGTKWLAIDLWDKIGESANLTSVHGTSWKNVWVVGYQTRGIDDSKIPYIINYDGLYWHKYGIDVDMAPYNVYVVSNNDVWVCGTDGIVGHFNGSEWEMDTVTVDKSVDEEFLLYDIKEIDLKIHLLGNRFLKTGENQVLYYFQYNNNWLKIDSAFIDKYEFKWGSKGQFVSTNKELYSFGYGGIYKNKDKHWNNIFNLEGISALYIQDNNNMICTGNFNVYHNDGNNWEKIIYDQNTSILLTGIWMSKNEAIIIGNLLDETPQKTIVLRGE